MINYLILIPHDIHGTLTFLLWR